MNELGLVLFVLFIFMAIVTVVGHGIWVVLAAIFGKRKLTGEAGLSTRTECPRCGSAWSAGTKLCGVCGWPRLNGERTNPQAALATLKEQLARLAELQVVDADTRAAIAGAIREQEDRIAAAAAEKMAAAQAAAAAKAGEAATAAVGEQIELQVVEQGGALTEPVAPERVAPPVDVAGTAAERVREYALRRMAEMEGKPATSEHPAMPEPKKREALSRLFAAFMEEKNIRWGELVGGLLIVGCSVALVISFWSEIAERPMLKFVLFNGVTAALFGVGLYTDRRWKIRTTSQGLLIIATLLVPLNFLAIAAFTQGAAANDVITVVGEAFSTVLFSLLVYFAAQVIAPGATAPLVIGVLAPSLVQLLVRRWADPAAALSALYALATGPIACYVATTSLETQRVAREPEIDEPMAHRLFAFLGVVSAATFFPLALLAWRVPTVEETIHRLSPLVVWCGVPALVVGLVFWKRGGWGRGGAEPPGDFKIQDATGGSLSLDPSHTRTSMPVAVQTAGLAVGVLGAGIMAGAAVAAWPDPATLLPVAAMNFVALTAVALWFGIPAAHLPAGLALVAIWLVSIYVWRSDVGWTLTDYEPLSRVLVSAMSGRMLVPLVAVFGGVAGVFARSGRREDGLMYGILAAATAAASLALVLWFGFALSGDPENIVWTLGTYAIAACVAAAWIDRPGVAWVGPVLVLATLWQALVYRWVEPHALELPRVTALLVHATLMAVGAAVLIWFRLGRVRLGSTLRMCAAISSLLGVGLLVASLTAASTGAVAIYFAWVAVVWLGLALLTGWAWVFSLAQVAAVVAIFSGVTAAVVTRDWYVAAAHPWLDPWFVAAQGIALAGYALVMCGVRWWYARAGAAWAEEVIEAPRPRWYVIGSRLLDAPWPAVDRVLQLALTAAFVAVAIYAAVPGVGQELAPLTQARLLGPAVRVVTPIDAFQVVGIDQTHAADLGVWLFGAAVLAVIAATLPQRRHVEWWVCGLVVVLAMVCPLLAARWESEVAVASALRWLSAGFFVVASAVLWMLARRRAEWFEHVRHVWLRNLLIGLAVMVYVAMGSYVAASGLRIAGTPRAIEKLLPWAMGWCVVAALVALGLATAGKQRDTKVVGVIGESKALGELVAPKLPAIVVAGNVLLVFAFCPLAVVLAFAVAAALDQHPIVGPDPLSWFRRIGWDVTYGVPLAMIALGLVGHAIRDRSSPLAFSAGLLANVVATIVVLMRLARSGGGLDEVAWVTIAQVNGIVAGVAAPVWLAAVRRGVKTRGEFRAPKLLVTQVALAAVLCGTFLAPAVLRLADMPDRGDPWVAHAGGVLGWIAFGLAAVAAGWLQWWRMVHESIVAYFLALLVAIVALTSLRWDIGDWRAFHVLVGGLVAAAWGLPLVTAGINSLRRATTESATAAVRWELIFARLFGAAAVLVALRALDGDPLRPWWTIGVLAAIALRNVIVVWRTGGRGSMWIAAALANTAVSIWWVLAGSRITGTSNIGQLYEFLWVNVIAAAGMAAVSGLVEFVRTRGDEEPRRGLAFHRFAAWAIVFVLLGTTAVGLVGDLLDETSEAYPRLGWWAWWGSVAAAVAGWWDRRARWRMACMYMVGLVAVGMYLDGLNLRLPLLAWAVALALAAYSLATSFLWSRRGEIGAVLARVAVPGVNEGDVAGQGGHGWLVAVNGLWAVAVVALVAWIEVTMPEFRHRMIAAYAIGAEGLALGLLARGAVRSPLQYLSLVFGVLFAVAFGWAWLPPEMPAPWLHRIVVAIVSLAAMMLIYGLGLTKLLRRENEWTRAGERLVPLLTVIAAILLLGVLGIEVTAYLAERPVPVAWPALLAVAVALVGLAVSALVSALVPGRDPLGLSERGRTAYVYAAEMLGAITFLHIRVTMPWLFSGWFLRFWPLVVMVIAFVGVGLGEFFQRRKTRVLAGPLTTTGALLPLLPALGFWIQSADSDVHYSLTLLVIGVLYGAVSALRKSTFFAVLAALAANGSLWYLLSSREGLGIAEHPQLWLIPPALCVLVAGYLNRARLSPEQSAALRYGSAIVIYGSSTAEIFINGVADAPWLPVVLAGLSIVGVFAGILLRVRAFLYLGATFLVVSLLTVIWYAAVERERTWILWVAGIVTGALIILLFGVFEKRRDDVLRMVERLKQWDA